MPLQLTIQDGPRLVPLGTIADGIAGTAQTVGALWAVVQASIDDPVVRLAAQAIGSPENLYGWCRSHVKFQRDPPGMELIRTPRMLLMQVAGRGYAQGDCDDLAALGCSVLAAMGRTPVVSTVGALSREAGGRFQHIFFGYRSDHAPGGVVLMDPQERFPPNGLPAFPLARLWWADGEHAAVSQKNHTLIRAIFAAM